MSEIKKGNLKTKDLVDMFGTKKQKHNYQRDKKLGGSAKQRILTKARKYCDIEDLGQGNFIIHKVYIENKDDPIVLLKKGLYASLAPMILVKLAEEHYNNNNFKITLPFLGWAKMFDVVNENYSLIKYNQNKSSDELEIDKDIMLEYFEKMDDCIRYYLQECLTILSKPSGLDLIDFDAIRMVRKKRVVTQENENGGVDITPKEWDEVLSDSDRKFVYACEDKAKEFAGIVHNKEKFYGTKSLIYNSELKRLLKERDILFTYSAFNIYCKNIKNIEATLDKLQDKNVNSNAEFVKFFNDKFIEYIDNKAKRLHNNELKKVSGTNAYIKEYRLDESYLNEYNRLSNLTIKIDTPSLKQVIGIDDNSTESIMEKFNINIVK